MWGLKAVTRVTALIFLLLGLSPGTWAQGSGKTIGDLLKKIEVKAQKVNIKKKSSALPSYKKFRGRKRAKVNLRKVKPPPTSKMYFEEGTDEGELEQVTDQGIDQLYKLTQRYKRSSKRGELWLRLAELYVDKARLIEYRLQKEFDKELEAYNSKKTKRRPRLNLKPAQNYNKKAIQLYEWFVRDFPKDDKMDQALFFLGYNLFELGETKKGEKYYQQLTKNYPKSPYVDESNFALGEYYFENEKWKKAVTHYTRVAKNRRGRLYSFALYKLGWCQFKLGDYRGALRSLEKVVYVGRRSKGEADRTGSGMSRIRLASEAIKDLIVFYAEAGSYKKAREYFSKVAGPKSAPKLVERLAYYYGDTGNRKAARYLFKSLIKEDPLAAKSYDYQYQIIGLYSGVVASKEFREELFAWIAGYGPGSAWAEANSNNKQLVSKATELIETTLRNFVLQLHQTAQNSKAPYSQKQAKTAYRLYFDSFSNSKKSDEMHFFYGELLFDIQDYEQAAYHYLWVSDNAPNSQYYEKAILNAILALEKKLPSEADILKTVGKDNKERVEFNRTVAAFVKVAHRYFEKYPKGESTTAIKYKVGSLHYYYNQYDEALVMFRQVVIEDPKSKFAEYSANLILDIYNIKKDYDGLAKAAEELLAVPAIANSRIGSQVRGIKQNTAFKQAQNLAAKGDHLQSAKAYEDFVKRNPKSPLVTSAMFNAAVAYENGHHLSRAMAMYVGILKDGGAKKDLKKKAQKFLAINYEKTGQYKKAAQAYENYAKENPKDKDSSAFYFNAAIFRAGLGHYKSALSNYQAYYDTTKSVHEKGETLFLMGKAWEKRGNSRRALGYYERYMNEAGRDPATVIECAFTIAQIYEARKQRSKGLDWYKKTVGIQQRLAKEHGSLGTSMAAEAKFKLVYETYREFNRIKIRGSQANQQKALNKKLEYIDRLKKELATVIAYDDGFMVVAALALQGQANQSMAAAIFNAPKPKNLDEEGLKQYMAGLDEKFIKPFRETAIVSYKSAVEKGFQLQGYNEWLKIAMKELNKLDVMEYPDYGEKVFLTHLPDKMGL